MEKISAILGSGTARLFGILTAIGYFFFYLYSIGNFLVAEMPGSLSFRVVENWQEIIFKPIAPFLWESIAVFSIFDGLSIFISVPNIIIAVLLSFLVFLNIAVAVFSYSISKVCQLRPEVKGILGFLPGLFTGFVCCAPTFIIALGPVVASLTIYFIQVRPFLIPASFVIMSLGFVWSLNRIPLDYIRQFQEQKL